MKDFDKDFFDGLIKDSYKYYAHCVENGGECRHELLSEHSALTYSYARTLAKDNSLVPIIKILIRKSLEGNLEEALGNFVEEMFWAAIAFHDLGKMNAIFQKQKMNNNEELLYVDHPFSSQHSVISIYIYLAIAFQKMCELEDLTDGEQIFLCNIILYLSYPIYNHHEKALFECQDEDNWCFEQLLTLRPFLSLLNLSYSDETVEKFHQGLLLNANFNCLFEFFNEENEHLEHGFPLFALVKLEYSLLTTADYLATAHFMNHWDDMYRHTGFINEALRSKIIGAVQSSKPYNKSIIERLEQEKFIQADDYKDVSCTNLNILREGMAVETLHNIGKNLRERLFYLEAPTGGGKTNISILALAELLKCDSSINKVFYVFPFTTLITQTAQTLKDTLSVKDVEVFEMHSKAEMGSKKHGDEYLNYLDNIFMDYPIVLLSHVRFFNVITTNKKDTNYLLQRLANSVVIMDELQTYPPAIWDKMAYFISEYATCFNMRFILMSATLPKLGKLLDLQNEEYGFVPLISNKGKYFQNPNFCNRIKFDFSLLELGRSLKEQKGGYLEKLAGFVIEKSAFYAEHNQRNPQSVFTVIEFITKRTAGDFLKWIKQCNRFFDDVYILSGTILEPQKQKIIKQLRSISNRNKKILLITTQVVEAGVDIDMDLGFKDVSLIDSEEQIAGRVNRNASKKGCKLYLFDCDSEKILYGNDARLQVVELKNTHLYKNILESKDFDFLYDIIMTNIKESNQSIFKQNIQDLYNAVISLNYPQVNNCIRIIDNTSITVFIPMELDKDLLREKLQIARDFNCIIGNAVDGKEVWGKYLELVLYKNENFINNKLKMRQLMSLMSSFTFSIYPSGKDYEILKTFGSLQYGFFYLESWESVYSLEDGINTQILKDTLFF